MTAAAAWIVLQEKDAPDAAWASILVFGGASLRRAGANIGVALTGTPYTAEEICALVRSKVRRAL